MAYTSILDALNGFSALYGTDAMTTTGGGGSTTYATQLDEASSTVTYVGKAVPGSATSAASWQIQRITTTGADLVIEFADGNSSFDNIWDDRASLSYS